MKIYLGADHGGFDTKNELLKQLEAKFPEHEFVDLGAKTLEPLDDFPDYAEAVARNVAGENDEVGESEWKALGILICRSGNGMCIAANKVKGIYASLGFSAQHGLMARRDDNANVLCLDADYKSEEPIDIAMSFINAKFAGFDTKYGRRFGKVLEIEKKGF